MEQLGNSLVRVYYRIYPVNPTGHPKWESIKVRGNSRVYVKKVLPHKEKSVGDFWEFEVDGIFNNSKQDKVFNDIVPQLIEKLENGHNAVIISFGKTGTGKSATTTGLEFSEEDYGMGPRIIKKLLRLKHSLQSNKKLCIKMSYGEFSGSEVYDLFRGYPNRLPDPWSVAQKLKKVKIISELDALRELYAGEGRKDVKPIKNYNSHLNTSILSFYVTTKDLDYSPPHQITGKIHLVDLAGSDTVGNLSSIFKTKIEVGNANLTKTYMEQFFLALCQRSNELIKIKQRANPLIYFLGGDVRTQSSLRFVGHISTAEEDYALTLSMLKFGQIVRGFTPTVVNLEYEISPEHKLKYLQSKVEELEKERIQNSILLNQDISLNLNCDRTKHLQKSIKEYLRNQITDIDILSVADASAIFKMFKDMLDQKEVADQRGLKETTRGESSLSISKRRSNHNNVKDKSRFSAMKVKTIKEKVDKEVSTQDLPVEDQKAKSQTSKSNQDVSTGSFSYSQLTGRSPKKTKSRTGAGNRPSFKRRSLLSINNLPEQMAESSILPSKIPDNADAWNEYSKNSSYNLYTEEYKSNEKSILDAYNEYLTEIKKLHVYKDEIGAMKQELLEAQILMKFKEKTGDVDKYTETILSEAKILCQNKKETAEQALIKQEEIVLRCLAELKIYMNNRLELKKKVTDDFENYCKIRYNIPLPQVKSLTDMETIKESKYSTPENMGEPTSSEEKDINRELLDQERKEQLAAMKGITEQERRKIRKSRYFSKPYILVALPDRR